MKTYKVSVFCQLTGQLFDSRFYQAKSAKQAKGRMVIKVEASLDLEGDYTCESGNYPSRYTVEARLAVPADYAPAL